MRNGLLLVTIVHSLDNGSKASSIVCSRHFNTPTSLLTGNDRLACFKPIKLSVVNNFLSTLG